jgi:glutamate synthase (NADPH/NADH) small chain
VISAKGKRVVILGGGDTGADCLGTVHRQGAASVFQLEILPRPPDSRAPGNPWPQWANIQRTSGAHEEGGMRDYAVSTRLPKYERASGEARGRARRLGRGEREVHHEEVPGSEFEVACDLVLLALGFLGPEKPGPIAQLGLKLTERGNVWADENKMTSVEGIFAAGDMRRGQSLIVWAIAEGRQAARGVDLYLMGKSDLP